MDIVEWTAIVSFFSIFIFEGISGNMKDEKKAIFWHRMAEKAMGLTLITAFMLAYAYARLKS